MSGMHVRIMCRCITCNVVVSQLSLVEARDTHVRANNEHTPEASLAHANIFFLWQGVAVDLNVKCSKLKNDVKGMHK